MRPRAEARVAGVREVLAAAHALPRHDADRVPVQVHVQRHRAVVVQHAHDVGARAVDGQRSVPLSKKSLATSMTTPSRAAKTSVPTGITKSIGVLARRVRVRLLIGKRLRDADGASTARTATDTAAWAGALRRGSPGRVLELGVEPELGVLTTVLPTTTSSVSLRGGSTRQTRARRIAPTRSRPAASRKAIWIGAK